MRLARPIPVWVSFVVAGLVFACLSTIPPEKLITKQEQCPVAYFVQGGGAHCPAKPASS